jgi:hypothetical protein
MGHEKWKRNRERTLDITHIPDAIFDLDNATDLGKFQIPLSRCFKCSLV